MSSREVSENETGPSGSVVCPANSTPPEQEITGAPVHMNIVTDANTDIAISESQEKIIVGVPGRQRLQRMFVRKSGTGGKTVTGYKPDDDAPANDRTISIIPTVQEIEGRPETMEFLLVGIVLAENPNKYSTKSTGVAGGRNKQRDEERAQRGTMAKEANILRAMVATTEFISTGHVKYYVACHQTHGICNMRLISGDTIFFFEEIWTGIPDGISSKERKRQLGASCKKQAARDKRPPQRAKVPISTGLDPSASSIIDIAPISNAANHLLMQYSIYAMTKEPSAITALGKSLENILPDLLERPTDEGIIAFYDFDAVLDLADAEKVVVALEAMYPSITKFSPPLIVELHAALRRTNTGGKLPYRSLVAFLRWGHDRAVAGWASERINTVVESILRDIEISDEIQMIVSTKTTSKMSDGPIDLTPFVASLRVAVYELAEYLRAQAKALRDQHGGIAKHNSVDDIMIKIGNCVDKTSLKLLEEQVFAIHAEQMATANSGGVKYAEECIALIDQALAICH